MLRRSLLLGLLLVLLALSKSYRLPKYQFNVKKYILSSSLAVLLSISTVIEPVHSLLAPLAEVGVREFLVKDGRQWLRLSQPVGNDVKLGSRRKSSSEMEIQESLELPRLRLEQVGFTNNPAWQKALADVTLAKTMIEDSKDLFIGKAFNNNKAKQKYESLIQRLQELISVIKDKDSSKVFKSQEECAQSFAGIDKYVLFFLIQLSIIQNFRAESFAITR